MSNKTKKWFKYTGIRTIKTMAETMIAVIGVDAMGFAEVDWLAVLSSALLSGIVTVLSCIKGIPEVKEEK